MTFHDAKSNQELAETGHLPCHQLCCTPFLTSLTHHFYKLELEAHTWTLSCPAEHVLGSQ